MQRFVKLDDLKVVELLLEFHHPMLHFVGSLEMARLLASHGYVEPDHRFRVAFIKNLSLQNDELVDFYVEHGFNLVGLNDVSKRAVIKHTPLKFLSRFAEEIGDGFHGAIKTGDYRKIKLFYRKDELDKIGDYGLDALGLYMHLSFRQIDIAIVRLLRTDQSVRRKNLCLEYIKHYKDISLNIFKLLFNEDIDQESIEEMKCYLRRIPSRAPALEFLESL